MAGDVVTSYRDLLVWQRAIDLTEAVYALTRQFPRDELYGLTSQTRRAAVSVAANIAEGYGRETRPAYVSFLRIAQGSLKELETHVIIAARVGATEVEQTEGVLLRAEELGKMLRSLIRKLA